MRGLFGISPDDIHRMIETQKDFERVHIVAPPIISRSPDLRKVGTIFGMNIMLDMTDVPAEEKDDKYYETRKAFDEIAGEKLYKAGKK